MREQYTISGLVQNGMGVCLAGWLVDWIVSMSNVALSKYHNVVLLDERAQIHYYTCFSYSRITNNELCFQIKITWKSTNSSSIKLIFRAFFFPISKCECTNERHAAFQVECVLILLDVNLKNINKGRELGRACERERPRTRTREKIRIKWWQFSYIQKGKKRIENHHTTLP